MLFSVHTPLLTGNRGPGVPLLGQAEDYEKPESMDTSVTMRHDDYPYGT
jgi:hypothetical protein